MIRRLFEWLVMPNDWIQIWCELGKWYTSNDPNDVYAQCSYVIWFSKSRNRYKLSLSGYKPKYHKLYVDAVKQFSNLNWKLNSIPSLPTNP